MVLLNGSKRLSEVRSFEIKWICRHMRQIQPETGEYLVFFKMIIQLYLLRSFFYSLTYYIKEVIKGKIFWRLNLKVLAYEVATSWNRGIPGNFSKHLSNCICFVYFYIFELLYQRGYQRQYFWTLHFKVLAYEAFTAWNRGIPGKI